MRIERKLPQNPTLQDIEQAPQGEVAHLTQGEVREARVDALHGDQFEAQGLVTSPGLSPASPPAQEPTTAGVAANKNLLRLQLHELSGASHQPLPRQTTKGAAERLYNAMKGVGTNEKEIFRVLQDRSSEEIEVIHADFQDLYKVSLDSRLTQELSGKDLQKATLLLLGDQIDPVQKDVELLRTAMEGVGTDEKSVLDILYGKSQPERQAIIDEYQRQTGRSLEKDIRKEHSRDEQIFAEAVLKRGVIGDADKIRAAMRGLGTDEKSVFRAMEGKSPEELQQLQEQYKEYYQRDLKADLEQELSGGDRVKAMALLQKGSLSGADKLRIAMVGVGTDEDAIRKVFNGTPGETRAEIVAEYNATYGDLLKDLKGELSRTQFDEVQSLIERGKLSPAENLNRAMRGFGTDEEGVLKALDGLSPEELTGAKTEYQTRYGRSLEGHIRAELDGQELEKALLLLERGHFTLAEKIHYATTGKNADPKAIFKALEQADPAERAQLEASFQEKYGESVTRRIAAHLSGPDELKAEYLMQHGSLSLEQTIDVALEGMGTREKELFQAIEAASPEERAQILSDTEIMSELRSELSDRDFHRTELLLKNGSLTRTEQIHFAVAGLGTDEAMLHKALEGLSPEQRLQLQTDYRAEYGQDLMEVLRSELGKRHMWEVEDALALPPQTLRERLDRAETRTARERGHGSAVANLSDAVMDVFSRTGRDIDQEMREYRHIIKETQKGHVEEAQAEPLLVAKEEKIDELNTAYREEKDAVAGTVSSIATMSVATAAIVATGGMAALPAAAAVSASAGATKVLAKQVIVGNSYDLKGADGIKDFAIGAGEGLALVAMGHAGDMATAAIGKQVLAAQGKDVSTQGLMLLGRKALRDSGQTITKELVEKASREVLIKAGNDFFKKSLLHKVAGSAVRGAVKGAVFSGVSKGVKSAVAEETWEGEFTDALRKILSDTGKAAAGAAKSWAISLSALQLGSHVNQAMMTRLKHFIGEKLAKGATFSEQELLKAGRKVLGAEASSLSSDVIQRVGREKLLVDMGAEHLARNFAGETFEIVSEQVLKRGTAAYTRTLIKSLDDHDIWNDGLLDAIDKMWHSSNKATVKDATQWGGKDIGILLAKHVGAVRPGSATEALLASLLWRSLSAGLK